MQKEFAEENLLFWRAADIFTDKYCSDAEITTKELIQDAKQIFDTYISQEGAHTINLPASITDPIKKIFTDAFVFPKGINQWIFNPAYQSIFDLMCRDTFFRFRNSEEGKVAIARVIEDSNKFVN